MNAAPVVLAALLGALLLAAVPSASQDAAHGFYNEGPDGASRLAAHVDAVVHSRVGGLSAGDTLLVLGPEVPYTDAEVATLRAFVRDGGRLVIADDVGAGRGLLARLDINVTLEAAPVYSPVFDTDPRSVIVTNTGFAGWPDALALGRARAVQGQGQPLLVSHELSWLDRNDDGRPGLSEPRGAFAFAMLRAVDAGDVLVIGSAQVLDNAGHPLRDGLLAWAGQDGRRIVLDDGHHAQVDPVGMGVVLSGQAGWPWWLLPAAVGLVAIRTFQVRPVRVRARRARRQALDSPVLQELDP